MAIYNTVAGFVQFDLSERKAAGQTVRDVLVQAVGSGGQNVKITLWPEFAHAVIVKGDFVASQGKFTSDSNNGKTYNNLSASDLNVNGQRIEKQQKEQAVDNAIDDESEDSPF